MRALVSGGAGFIGSALVTRLARTGHVVHVVDDLSTGSLANLADARGARGEVVVHELDVRAEGLTDLVASVAPEVVFHLAAQVDVRASVADPIFDAHVNVLGTIAMLEAVRALARPARFVLAASGGTLYGAVDADALPLAETALQRPLSPYGVSKRAAIDYLDSYRELHGLRGCALALANVYGPRQRHSGEAAVVTAFIEAICNDEPLTIYGDGSQTRDFVYVEDVVDAFLLAGSQASGDVRRLLYNIGTGVEISVADLASTLEAAAGRSDNLRYRPERTGELKHNSLDPSLAAAELGWRPTTDLVTGLASTLRTRRVDRESEEAPGPS